MPRGYYTRKVKTEPEFWSRVKKGPGCWLWLGCINADGYGVLSWNGRYWLAHRLAWTLVKGSPPKGCLLHTTCDNPRCIRPDHCSEGTRKQNADDRDAKGRVRHGEVHPRAKLTLAAVMEIRSRVRAGESQVRVARAYGVDPSSISNIMRARNWRRSL